jgi:hypothetical protein
VTGPPLYEHVRAGLGADDIPEQEALMPSVAKVLAVGGILRADDVVAIARASRLDIACAAVLLAKESYGGQNVWGRDGVPTGGAYTKGGQVTQANYAAYRAALKAGTAGRQGCGPTQLTYGPFQDQADARGGCWRWEVNCAVGFELLAGLIRQYGERDGFRRYNGSGAAAEAYGRDAVTRLVTWRQRLASATNGPTSSLQARRPQPPDPHLSEDDDVLFIRCQPDANTTWWAVLDAPFFVGIATPSEIASAQAAVAAGARVLDVAPATWTEFDRRSHAVCDNPRPVTQYTPPAAPSALQKVSPS